MQFQELQSDRASAARQVLPPFVTINPLYLYGYDGDDGLYAVSVGPHDAPIRFKFRMDELYVELLRTQGCGRRATFYPTDEDRPRLLAEAISEMAEDHAILEWLQLLTRVLGLMSAQDAAKLARWTELGEAERVHLAGRFPEVIALPEIYHDGEPEGIGLKFLASLSETSAFSGVYLDSEDGVSCDVWP